MASECVIQQGFQPFRSLADREKCLEFGCEGGIFLRVGRGKSLDGMPQIFQRLR